MPSVLLCYVCLYHICSIATSYQLCTASIVNDPGYRIDDAAIDASSEWHNSVDCMAAAARFDYNINNPTLGWCSCKYSMKSACITFLPSYHNYIMYIVIMQEQLI